MARDVRGVQLMEGDHVLVCMNHPTMSGFVSKINQFSNQIFVTVPLPLDPQTGTALGVNKMFVEPKIGLTDA